MQIFLIFIIFIAWFAFARKRTTYLQSKKAENFWEKESIANNTRKTSLDCLEYITIPLNLIKLGATSADDFLTEYTNILKDLTDKKIVNLTGISNTDLKLKYGSSNLPLLTNYDQNFTLLVQTLNKMGKRLNELGNTHLAILTLEFSVACGSDISATYKLLAKLYVETGQSDKIKSLIQSARSLNSLMKNSIIKNLKEIK